MPDDIELLRRYASEGSEESFAELVRGRLDFVYSVAMRHVGGDSHLAKDVAQRVFSDLARKAAILSRRGVLTGWLYRSTQFAASDVVRAERRRRAREQEAQTMLMNEDCPTNSVDWARIRPVLDRAMGELSDRDRDAVMLRFFEGKAFAEVGDRLRLSEDGARMRVDRALQKLCVLLERKGVTSTAAALGIALAAPAGMAAPAGLAAAVTVTAVAGATSAGAAGTFLTFLTMNKTTSAIITAVVVITAVAVPQQIANGKLREETALLEQHVGSIGQQRSENQRLLAAAAARGPGAQLAAELAQMRARAGALQATLAARQSPPRSSGEEAPRAGPRTTNTTPKAWAIQAATPAAGPMVLRLETPERAFQSILIAAISGRPDLLPEAVAFDGAARARLDAFFARLPESARGELRTADAMLAPVLPSWLWKVGQPTEWSVQGSFRETLDQADVRLKTNVRYTSTLAREESYPFHYDGRAWKLGPVSDEAVEELLSALDPATGKPRAPAADPAN